AIIDQQAMPRLYSFKNFWMRKMDTMLITERFVVIEGEGLAGNEIDLTIPELPNAQLWTLKISQNANRAAQFLFHIANALDEGAHQVMVGMTHIDAEHIRACLKQLADDGFLTRRRTQRGENLDLAVALHGLFVPVTVGFSVGVSSVS